MPLLLPERMNKFYIIGKKIDLHLILDKIQRIGRFHINYFDKSVGLGNFSIDITKDLEIRNTLEEFLKLSKKYNLKLPKPKYDGRLLSNTIIAFIKKDLETIKAKKEELNKYREILEKLYILLAFGIKDTSLLRYKEDLELVKNARERQIPFIRKTKYNGETYLIIKVEDTKLVRSSELVELDDVMSLVEKDTKKAINSISIAQKKTSSKLKKLIKRYEHYVSIYGSAVLPSLQATVNRIGKAHELKKIVQDSDFFIISCFLPADTDPFKLDLGDVKIIKTTFLPEEAPTARQNTGIMHDFSFLTWLYGTPAYNEIDPSKVFAITFPLLFGAIVGDVGYGIVLFLGAIALTFLNKSFKRNLTWIFLTSALSSIAFGFLFGEFFGNLIPIPALLFYRLSSLSLLLLGTVLSGSIILTISAVFNEIDATLSKNRKKAVSGVGWVLLNLVILSEIANILIYSSFTIYLLPVLLAALVIIGFGDAIELSEVITLFTNTLSYIRIAAIGLSSIMIALLINKAGLALMANSVILGVIVLAVLHLLNVGMIALIAFLQSLRLEYVEFLSKFFRGEGTEYKPLKRVKINL